MTRSIERADMHGGAAAAREFHHLRRRRWRNRGRLGWRAAARVRDLVDNGRFEWLPAV